MSLKNLFSSAGGASSDVIETEVVSTASIRDVFEDNSCVALYRFEGDATDTSGNFNGTASNLTYGTGKFGQCGVFNGSNTLIYTGIPQSALIVSSFSVWVYPLSGSAYKGVFGDHYGNYTGIIGFQYDKGTCSFGYGTGSAYVGAGITLALNTWTHLVGIITGTGLQIYKNGLLEKSVSGGALSPRGNLLVGRAFDLSDRYWSGSIDQFRIFNRALTQEEVTSLYMEE